MHHVEVAVISWWHLALDLSVAGALGVFAISWARAHIELRTTREMLARSMALTDRLDALNELTCIDKVKWPRAFGVMRAEYLRKYMGLKVADDAGFEDGHHYREFRWSAARSQWEIAKSPWGEN